MHHYLRPQYAPISIPIALSLFGTLIFAEADRQTIARLFDNPFNPAYLIIAPFFHSGIAHFLLNAMALHYIGGQLLLPTIGKKRFITLFIVALLTAQLGNSVFSSHPAIGISGGIMALLACCLRPYGKLPMKFLIIHDILRLKPFPLRNIAYTIVAIDICGIIFNWHFFAHAAHLTGFATGTAAAHILFPHRK